MKLSKNILRMEAIILGLPATIGFILLLPLLIQLSIVTVINLSNSSALNEHETRLAWLSVQLISGCVTIPWFWYLAVQTIQNKSIQFRKFFWAGIICLMINLLFLCLVLL